MSGFRTRDPGKADFWDERFTAGVTPWDPGAAPAALLRFLAAGQVAAGGSVLVPGCGRGWEVDLLDRAGMRVLAIDFSAAAVSRARAQLGERGERLVRQADFFQLQTRPFDWIYEKAFVPALPPGTWPAWADRVAALTAPGALLAGLFFIDPAAQADVRRGPPFAIRRDELDALLSASFECIKDEPVPDSESVPILAGRERWLSWRRRV
jgi:SAM-dependent methyltransferase